MLPKVERGRGKFKEEPMARLPAGVPRGVGRDSTGKLPELGKESGEGAENDEGRRADGEKKGKFRFLFPYGKKRAESILTFLLCNTPASVLGP